MRDTGLNEAMHGIRRNLPGFPTTFGPCERTCGRDEMGGRGGGPCLACFRDDLVAIVGVELADRYIAAVRELSAAALALEEACP